MEIHDVNTTSEIMLGSEDRFEHHNDEWDDFGEPMQEIEIFDKRTSDSPEITSLNIDNHPSKKNFESEGNIGGNIEESVQYDTEKNIFFDHLDEKYSISRRTIVYHDAGIFFSSFINYRTNLSGNDRRRTCLHEIGDLLAI